MNGVSSINVTEDISLITFNNLPTDLNVIAGIFNKFSEAGINIDMISQTAPYSSHVSVSFTVGNGDFVKVLEIVNKFKEQNKTIQTMVSSGNCKIQLYGEEMRNKHGVFAKSVSAVAGSGAEIVLITTSEIDISLLVPTRDIEDAVAALENEFGVRSAQ